MAKVLRNLKFKLATMPDKRDGKWRANKPSTSKGYLVSTK